MKHWLRTIVAGALALGPGAAMAAIDNTHHDMPYMTAGTAEVSNERCAFCHSITGLPAQAGLGKVGGFCVAVCHLSGSGISDIITNVVPTSPGVFTYASGTFTKSANDATTAIFTSGHGMDKTVLNGAMGVTGEGTAVGNTGWPYTQLDALQCTSCHSVHDATNPPFLNAKLSEAGSQTASFCQKCHNDAMRIEDFAATAQDHPTEFQWNITAAAGRGGTGKTTDTGTIMGDRELFVPTTLDGVVLNVVATGVVPATAGALNARTAHWNLGGHVVNTTTGLPTDPPLSGAATAGTDQFGCYSCHTVHVGVTDTNGLASILTVAPNLQDVCYGCHTLEPGTTGYGHPIDEEVTAYSTNGWQAVPLAGVYAGLTASRFRPAAATGASPWCVSCHDVHSGAADRMAIRAGATAATTSNLGPLNGDGAVCELCHLVSYNTTDLATANEHHPGRDSTAAYVGTYGFPTNLGWVTTDGLGDLDDGLSCPDCHVGDGTNAKRATAHNWQ